MVTKKTQQINVRMDEATLEAVDAWRREFKVVPGRPEAARKLLELGLSGGARHPTQPIQEWAQAIDSTIKLFNPHTAEQIQKWEVDEGCDTFNEAIVDLVQRGLRFGVSHDLERKADNLGKRIPELVEWAIDRLEDEAKRETES